MKRILLLLVLIAAFCATAHSQTERTFTFTTASNGVVVNQVGAGITQHIIVWNGTGTVATCSVKLEKSATGSGGWSDLIAAQTCTSNGASALTTDTANYVRVTLSTLTGASAGLSVRYIAFPPGQALSATIDTTGLATATNQTGGGQKSQVCDAGGDCATVTGSKLDVNASGTTETDSGTIAGGQSTGLQIGLNYVWNGTSWARASGTVAGSGAATGLTTVQGHASGTPIPSTITSATAPVSTMNSASANSGINAALSCLYDDVAPTTPTENNFTFWRCSNTHDGFIQLRDAAGNQRGANVDASNRLTTAPTMVSGSVASGAFAAGSIGAAAVVAGAIVDGADLTIGAKADAKSTATDTTPITAMQVWKQISASVQAIAALAATDPCTGAAKTSKPISVTTATTTVLVAASASNKVYICSIEIGPIEVADNIALVEDATGSCASPDAGIIGGTTAATGWQVAANGGISYGSGNGSIAITASTNVNVCLITSSAAEVPGVMTYVLAP